MSFWQDHDLDTLMVRALRNLRGQRHGHHLGEFAFATGYQLALWLDENHPEITALKPWPLGGSGSPNSWAQYLAGRLSHRISEDGLPELEGGFLSDRWIPTMNFRGRQRRIEDVEVSTPLAVFRIRTERERSNGSEVQ